MNSSQEQSLLLSIAISSNNTPLNHNITPQERASSFTNLEEFKKYPGRVAACVSLLDRDRVTVAVQETHVDITVASKLFCAGILKKYLVTSYSKLNEEERLSLRTAVIGSARRLVVEGGGGSGEARLVGMKLASVLSDIAVRDFPQRWPGFIGDVFVPVERGGLWCADADCDSAEDDTKNDGVRLMGCKICLEMLKLITEDCTDGDFNAKISSSRRNDVVIGLNEVSNQFLPHIFSLLSKQYSILSTCKSTLKDMTAFLTSQSRNVNQMTMEEHQAYTRTLNKQNTASVLLADCLATLEKFCQSMPLEWMLNTTSQDFVAALLHLLREDVNNLQVLSVACLEALAYRKLEPQHWFSLVSSLPSAIGEANQVAQANNIQKGGSGNGVDFLVENMPFHRGLSKLLAALIAAHIAFITTDKDIISATGEKFETVSAYLQLLTTMLGHPLGRIAHEQINTWLCLLRDPQITNTPILTPYMPAILSAYMTHTVRIRWDDVENGVHPMSSLFQESWDDQEEYNVWLADLRSKATQLFRNTSHHHPQLGAEAIRTKVMSLLNNHGNGEPHDHLDRVTNCLTPLSEANMNFEGNQQPLDYILLGLPTWSIQEEKHSCKKERIRLSVRGNLSQMADAIVAWTPVEPYMRLRRSIMLESLKHYWKHDTRTLPTGVDALLCYLCAQDDTNKNQVDNGKNDRLSSETVALRKRSGCALISVSKQVPHLLVPYLTQLSSRASTLLTSSDLLSTNRMHIYEFLSCVATAVEDPIQRADFISNVLQDSLNTLETSEVQNALKDVDGFLDALGVSRASNDPTSVTETENVNRVVGSYVRLFSAINQIFSVGKRCQQAAKKRPSGGLPLYDPKKIQHMQLHTQNFPDEGPVSIKDLAREDPFVPIWVRLMPTLINILDITLRLWRPEYQAVLLKHPIQRYVYAISDDEAYLAKKQEQNNKGVFGEGGTAGSIVTGWDRRDANLAPKWSGWLNELKNTAFQMLGLCAQQRVLYAPEMNKYFPRLISIVSDVNNLCAMEHRSMTQYLKQFIDNLLLSCPATMYQTHLTPFLQPLFEHTQYRLERTWAPIIGNVTISTNAISTPGCEAAASLALQGGEGWYASYYARGGLFVGDLDTVTSEAAVEKVRVEVTRTFCDVIQTALALKGEWALVLANQSKEEQALKKNDPSKLTSGPANSIINSSGMSRVNADGTPRSRNQKEVEARQTLRIRTMCHYLLLEDQRVAGPLVLVMIQCLNYPDQYTCRRVTRICHRILETSVPVEEYSNILGNTLFLTTVKSIVMEPKWMVGMEWDMIALLRDIFCRMVLGQTLLPGGQGAGLQQVPDASKAMAFEQSKNAANPLQGGGILCVPSKLPCQILANLPGVGEKAVEQLITVLREKVSAKEQKDTLRDFLRIAAEQVKSSEREGGAEVGMLGRAVEEESLLNQKNLSSIVPNLPEILVTKGQMMKNAERAAVSQVGSDVLGGGALTNFFR